MFRQHALWKGRIFHYLFTQAHQDLVLSGSRCWSNTSILLIKHFHIKFSPTSAHYIFWFCLYSLKLFLVSEQTPLLLNLLNLYKASQQRWSFNWLHCYAQPRQTAANTNVCHWHGQFWSPTRITQIFQKGKSYACLQQKRTWHHMTAERGWKCLGEMRRSKRNSRAEITLGFCQCPLHSETVLWRLVNVRERKHLVPPLLNAKLQTEVIVCCWWENDEWNLKSFLLEASAMWCGSYPHLLLSQSLRGQTEYSWMVQKKRDFFLITIFKYSFQYVL